MLSGRAQFRLLRNCWLVNMSELYRMGWQAEGEGCFFARRGSKKRFRIYVCSGAWSSLALFGGELDSQQSLSF
jgi:hypothetical protein